MKSAIIYLDLGSDDGRTHDESELAGLRGLAEREQTR